MQDEWTLLLQLQSEKLAQQEQQYKEQEALRKFYYKKQLDQQLANSKGRGARERIRDSQMLKERQQQEKAYYEDMSRREEQKRRIRRDAMRHNLSVVMQKEQEKLKLKKKESDMVSDILRMEAQMIVRERRTESERKSRQKNQLCSAYNDKMNQGRLQRQQFKTQQSLYLQQFKRIQAQKQQQREAYMNRIKYGYRQNPQAYNNIIQLQHKKDVQRQDAITNYLSPGKASEYLLPDRAKFTSNAKHQEKQKQIQHLNRMQQLNVYTPQQKRKMRDVERQLQMGDILDRQIQEKQMKRIKEKHMDNKQLKFNKDAFQGSLAVPGLSLNDYHRNKQRQMLNNSLGLDFRPQITSSKAL